MMIMFKGAIRNILVVVLCLGMVGAGMMKILSYPDVVQAFQQWHFPIWFMFIIGAVELIIGICIFIPQSRKYAVWALILLMQGALFTHVGYGEYHDIRGPILVTLASILLFLIEKSLQSSKNRK